MDSQQKLKAKFSLIYVIGVILAVLALQEYVIGPRRPRSSSSGLTKRRSTRLPVFSRRKR